MGIVYLGRDLRLDMDVAIKFRGMTHSDATLWLKREFRAVASLRHRNLVELYELVAQDRSCYFTMEYLPGLDPRRWVERTQGHLPGHAAAETHPTSETTRSAPGLAMRTESRDDLTPAEHPGARRIEPQTRPVPRVDFARVRIVL